MTRRLALLLTGFILLAGCSVASILEPTKDLSRFYLLSPMDSSARGVPITYSGTEGPRQIAIGLGPVKFPSYLARPEIVTHALPNRIDLSDIDRWGEPLDKNFVTVLGQNLTTLMGAKVATFPWYRPIRLDYQITLDITRFDTDSNGTAQIIGRYEIKDPDVGDVLKSGDINLTDPAHTGESSAATLSRALGDMSVQIADAIRATPHPPPHPNVD